MMLLARSLLFNLAFYLNLIAWLIGSLPFLLGSRKQMVRVAQAWGRSSLWLLRVLAGTRVELRHAERIPAGGLLVASKHQSFLETFALLGAFDDPAFILKRELTLIPLFGWYAAKAGMVSVDRKAGSLALTAMTRSVAEVARHGRQIVIFPEGTRRPPGAPPAYRHGVAHLYASLGVPCLPVALNSGLFWPRRRFIRRPGTIVIECLEPIPPGLPREAFMTEMRERIEQACTRLLADGLAELGPAAPVIASAEPAARPARRPS